MMKPMKWLPAIAVITLMLTSCGSSEQKEAKTTDAPAEQAAVINTTHAYICPMNCENSARMEPGQCVVCGMDLVKNPNYKPAETDTTVAATDTTSGAATHDDHENHEGHNH